MQLEFVPVEEFYFALTLAVKTLEDLDKPGLTEQVGQCLQEKFGQPSTVASGKQNNFNYVFLVKDVDNSPASQLVISIADWQGKLRLGSDYGWMLDEERKPTKSDKFEQRMEFSKQLRSHLENWLQIPFESD